MKLDETFLTRTKKGLVECKGKRIDSDYAIIQPWFSKDEYQKYKKIYYIINISSGLKISSQDYKTIKAAVENFETDLDFVLRRMKERGIDFDETIEKAEKEFNELLKQGNIVKEE